MYAYGCGALDTRAYRYSISTGASTPISGDNASNPVVKGNTILWTTGPKGAIGETNVWSVQKYDTASGAVADNVEASPVELRTEAVVSGSEVALNVVEDASKDGYALYLNKMSSPAAGPDTATFEDHTPADPLDVTTSCDRTIHLPAGRCAATRPVASSAMTSTPTQQPYTWWPMDGVQFELPTAGAGLSGQTFTSNIYNAALQDNPHCTAGQPMPDAYSCSMEYWLWQAQSYLLAKTLRIIVTPETGNACLSCVEDFANRANARGMRVGVVLRNSTAHMTTAISTWLNNFFTYFTGTQANKIAYVSLDNEVNNHAGTTTCPHATDAQSREIDCFDRYSMTGPPWYYTHGRQYINEAAQWARTSTRSTIVTTRPSCGRLAFPPRWAIMTAWLR